MPFVPSDQVAEQLRQVLEQGMRKRKGEIEEHGFFGLDDVKEWLLDEWEFPVAGQGNYPRGIVMPGDPLRESERREQDTGETATLQFVAKVYFEAAGMSRGRALRTAMRYGDLISYAVMRNAKVERPKDGTVLPGLFRFWPRQVRIGESEDSHLYGCEVTIEGVIDSSFSGAVGA